MFVILHSEKIIKNFELLTIYMTRHEQLIEALQHHFGFDTFKGNQEAIIDRKSVV